MQALTQQITGQFGSGMTGNQLQQMLQSGFQNAGADPAQIAALSNDQITGSGAWGSGAAPTATWNQQVMNAENSASPPAATAAPSSSGSSASLPTSPLQPAYIPTPPTAQATTYNPATTGAATYQNPYNPQTATNELTQAAQGQDQQQNQALMSMLAAQGISPGSSAAQAAMQNLSGTQAQALDPSLASAQEYGAGLGEQSGLANIGAINTAGLSNQAAENAAGQYGATANNSMTSQNLQDLLQQQEYNAGAYNSAGSQAAGYQNQDWLAQLQAQLGLQQSGLATSGSLAGDQANQQVPLEPSLFSQISSGLEGAASAAAPFFP
jgi:hypothetical protein